MSNFKKIIRKDIEFTVVNNREVNWPDGSNFWDLFANFIWEPITLDWVEAFSNKQKSFLDIGGWVGPVALWASKFNKSVHTFEPDPIAYKHLSKNAKLNASNIKTYNYAVTAESAHVSLFSRQGLGSSMTSMYTGESSGVIAEGFPFSEVLKLDDFGLIKIDIEGGERLIIDAVVKELTNQPIPLIISLHHGFFLNPDQDFEYVINKLSKVYSNFTLENGNSIQPKDIPQGFISLLCQ